VRTGTAALLALLAALLARPLGVDHRAVVAQQRVRARPLSAPVFSGRTRLTRARKK
jgi:hypothetical protein